MPELFLNSSRMQIFICTFTQLIRRTRAAVNPPKAQVFPAPLLS